MAPLSERTGITFREIMSGDVDGPDTRRAFAFDLTLVIPRLGEFLAADRHVAGIEPGQIDWDGVATRARVLPGCSVELFAETDQPRLRRFVFSCDFVDDQGDTWTMTGWKFLRQDSTFDVISDMSHVAVKLQGPDGRVHKGVVAVHPDEFLDQLLSIKVTDADSAAQEVLARQEFFAFLNTELQKSYRGVPLIFAPLSFFSPAERRLLSRLVMALWPDDLPDDGPTVDDVLRQLEVYFANADSLLVSQLRFALRILGALEVVRGRDIPALRRFARRRLAADGHDPKTEALRLLHTLVTLPYFAHPKGGRLLGYTPIPPEPSPRPDLAVVAPEGMDAVADRTWDDIIVGSGPAGSVLAHRLATAGRSVLIVEAGPYVPERSIDPDEILWTARLYLQGGLQRANDGSGHDPGFFVLQGGCVGGGGVINNAVCFQLPDRRFAHWQDRGFPVSRDDLAAAYRDVGRDLDPVFTSDATGHLNPSAGYLENALGPARKVDPGPEPAPGLYECRVNIARTCTGCGLCNVGCRGAHKNNALSVHLPRALEHDCRLCPETRAVRLESSQPGPRRWRVEHLLVKRAGRHYRLRAQRYLMCAGAVSSPLLLRRNRQDFPRPLFHRVGRGFSANIGSPMTAVHRVPVHTRSTLQIAHFVVPPAPDAGFVVETWFNPPGAQSLAVPGYFETLQRRLHRYASMAVASPLVGTTSGGKVSWSGNARRIELPLADQDRDALRDALRFLGKALLAGGPDHRPDYVLAPYGQGLELRSEADVDRFVDHHLQDWRKLKVGTGHPQGGCAMTEDLIRQVVDRDYRVRHFDNLHVCDGSVFPASSGVNPQWTIMALAADCARRLLSG